MSCVRILRWYMAFLRDIEWENSLVMNLQELFLRL